MNSIESDSVGGNTQNAITPILLKEDDTINIGCKSCMGFCFPK